MWVGRKVGGGEAEKEVKSSIQASVGKASHVLSFEAAHEMELGFPGGTSDKESSCNAGDARDTGSVPRSGGSSRVGSGSPFW